MPQIIDAALGSEVKNGQLAAKQSVSITIANPQSARSMSSLTSTPTGARARRALQEHGARARVRVRRAVSEHLN